MITTTTIWYQYLFCHIILAACYWYYVVLLVISEWKCSCWCASSIVHEQIKYSYVPRTWIGRIYVTQNDDKTIATTITQLTRKPASNSITHWSLCHGDLPRTISLIFSNCVQQVRLKDKSKVLVLGSWRNVATVYSKFAPEALLPPR